MNKIVLTFVITSISFILQGNLFAMEVDSLMFQGTDFKLVEDTAVLVKMAPSDELLDTINVARSTRKKKIIAALFAFPFPFGFVGAHRVVLGTKPWVPVVYVVTFGGCFGLLPLIDFFTIVFTKQIDQYENDPNIFMWLKD